METSIAGFVTGIYASINQIALEPNDAVLWTKVQESIETFLTTLWKDGSLAGTTTEEAFFVNIGRNTMTQEDIDNRRLSYEVGVALVRPAEFVTLRLINTTSEAF